MKNICKATANGKLCWIVSLTAAKGKRIKRYFQTEALAKSYLKKYNAEKAKGVQDFAELSPFQLSDIRTALSLLPNGLTLLDCVKSATNKQFAPSKTIKESVVEFLALKEDIVSKQYFTHLKGQLSKFSEHFADFGEITSKGVMDFCKSVSDKPKTQRHYVAATREFLDFAVHKDYWNINPFNKVHKSEIPKPARKVYKIPKVDTVKIFFERIEKSFPSLSGLFALVAFGGFRLAEAQRLEVSNIDFQTKEIVLPFYKAKTGQTWIMANMPKNVWEWLGKCPPNDDWTDTHLHRTIEKAREGLNLEDNALRHAFATYHYSLYRNEIKTQDLMRHTTAAMLKQTYLAGLVNKKTAEEYFKILPTVEAQ